MNYTAPPDDGEYPGLRDRLFALLLQLLPHHLLSQLMYLLTRSEWPPLKNLLIRTVVRLYDVQMEQAVEPDPEAYASFNHFFTRPLQPQARPITREPDAVACPVDGAVSQLGDINHALLFQAKGQFYSLHELLGGDAAWSERFAEGSFATLYLSPRDYHRIHMPLQGELAAMSHVPGRLFSVSPSTTRVVPRLFARNERVINLFETDAGAMALIMVGAIFVASMDTVWAGTVAPASRRISHWNYGGPEPATVTLQQGEEMGRFNMGSTVILLFEENVVEWDAAQIGRAHV